MLKVIQQLRTNGPLIRELELAYLESCVDDDGGMELNSDRILDWLSGTDIGVPDWMNMTIAELFAQLTLPFAPDHPAIAFLNRFIAEFPKTLKDFPNVDPDKTTVAEAVKNGLVPLKIFWHQLVAVCAMMKMAFRGENCILADAVGVGKTVEVLLMVAVARIIRLKHEHHDAKTGPFRWPPVGEYTHAHSFRQSLTVH